MLNHHTTIILCGGDINASHLPIATSGSNAMIPVNGKPVIGWLLGDLAQKMAGPVVIVTQSNNVQLLQYVPWAFQGRLEIEFALLEQKGSIVQSLFAGLEKRNGAMEATVLLGDTFIAEPFPDEENYVLVSNDFDDPRNWCLAKSDAQGFITQFFDKENTALEGLVALTGLYGFKDAGHLVESCKKALKQGGRELSDVLEIYGQKHPLRAVITSRWYDFGHMPHFLKGKHELLESRYFNEINIEAVTGVLHKTSTRTEKLRDEYNWYMALPESLKILTPRILNLAEHEGSVVLSQEYYGYPNLAELYLYGNFDLEIWKVAIQNLLQTHWRLKSIPGPVSAADALHIYWEKTAARIGELQEQGSFFRELTALEHIHLNGEQLDNLPRLIVKIKARCETLASTVEGTVIHGDFCLSNILYDIQNQLVRLIDPRGSFGKKGIYGDPRYDVAKLRHSLHGGYDFMMADLFSLTSKGPGHFQTDICSGPLYTELALFFDAELERAGYALSDIIFIEALLFLSMIPLHLDNPERQTMMYLQAIKTFNYVDCFERKAHNA